MRGDLIETFKIINGSSSYGENFFKQEIYCYDWFKKTESTNQLDFFAISFSKKLPNQIKNSSSIKTLKIKLDDFWKKKMVRKFKMALLGTIRRIIQQNLICKRDIVLIV